MPTATYRKHILQFKTPAGTSRGVLKTKETWFIILNEDDKTGIGECGILRGLSIDDRPDYEAKLKRACESIANGLGTLYEQLIEFPSIQIGLETAFKSLQAEDPFEIFPSQFSRGEAGIPIN